MIRRGSAESQTAGFPPSLGNSAAEGGVGHSCAKSKGLALDGWCKMVTRVATCY